MICPASQGIASVTNELATVRMPDQQQLEAERSRKGDKGAQAGQCLSRPEFPRSRSTMRRK